jgi:hypothetical protein
MPRSSPITVVSSGFTNCNSVIWLLQASGFKLQ